MITFDDFLENCRIINQNTFNEILTSLPEDIEEDDVDFYNISPDEVNSVCDEFLMGILKNNFDYAFVDDVCFENRTFELYDVESLEELEEIKELFSKWTITNYSELLSELKEKGSIKERDKKLDIFESFIDNIPITELTKLAQIYNGNKT